MSSREPTNNTLIVYDYIRMHPGCSAAQIANDTGLTKGTVISAITSCESAGLLLSELNCNYYSFERREIE